MKDRQENKKTKYDYNLVVIGAGSAGLVTAYIANALKSKVALIEKNKMGGDCLNTGCVPSKALIHSAKIFSYLNNLEKLGINPIAKKNVSFDFKNVMNEVQKIIKKIEPHDSIERYQALGVDCIKAKAEIISNHQIKVNKKIITTRAIVISTGASPIVPKILGLEKIDYLTSDNLWDLVELPKKLVVLGGGSIGLEMAQCFARLGSKVSLVELNDKLLINEDNAVSKVISQKFKDEGIEILTSHKAKEFVLTNNTGLEAKMICEHNGTEVEISFDKLILALGRKANITGFGLEKLGIKLKKNNAINTNPFLQTNIKNIYACGDVIGEYQFTHTAAHQAYYASINALLSPIKKFKVDNSVIPWAIFTDPEIARVGLNEKQAKKLKIDYQLSNYNLAELDRAITDRSNYGFIQVLTKGKTDKILGVSIVGSHASELIAEYILAIKHNIGLNKILSTIHIYPTLNEANKYVAGVWKKANTPIKIMKLVKKFHRFRRN